MMSTHHDPAAQDACGTPTPETSELLGFCLLPVDHDDDHVYGVESQGLTVVWGSGNPRYETRAEGTFVDVIDLHRKEGEPFSVVTVWSDADLLAEKIADLLNDAPDNRDETIEALRRELPGLREDRDRALNERDEARAERDGNRVERDRAYSELAGFRKELDEARAYNKHYSETLERIRQRLADYRTENERWALGLAVEGLFEAPPDSSTDGESSS